MSLAPLPSRSAWRHHTAREAVEVTGVEAAADGTRLRGTVTGVEDGAPWALGYDITVDPDWCTRRAEVRSLLPGDRSRVVLLRGADGRWQVDGRDRPDLGDCVDVDLEGSAMTNTLPVHRLDLAERTPAPAAYVRLDLSVHRLEQWYGPTTPAGDGSVLVAYDAPEFDARFDLRHDAAGLVLDYPFLATRLL